IGALLVVALLLGLLLWNRFDSEAEPEGKGGLNHPPPAEKKTAQQELFDLRMRVEQQPSAEVECEKLRQDLLAFRGKYPGTAGSVQAVLLLTKLPSSLDRLTPTSIAAENIFRAWQPKELVAVLGEHRGRHFGGVGCTALRHDGKYIASGGQDQMIW